MVRGGGLRVKHSRVSRALRPRYIGEEEEVVVAVR
jgi:hypothetical protein